MRISDWSSDVCSSDLPEKTYGSGAYRWRVRAMSPQDATLTGWSSWREFLVADKAQTFLVPTSGQLETQLASAPHPRAFPTRSEERRVGKEWVRTGRSRWWPYH